MGRQRTIDDTAFWRSPRMAGRTQEDRATLSYLLTSPFSNIIGVYPIVPRIAASEMGWDTDSQLIPVLRRLREAAFIDFDEKLSYVWVKIWWDHNSASMSVAGTLRQRTYEQIAAIPGHWRDAFVEDLLSRLPINTKKLGNLRALVQSALCPQDTHPDRVSIPYPCPTNSGLVNTTTNVNFNSNTTTTAPPSPSSYAQSHSAAALLDGIVVFPHRLTASDRSCVSDIIRSALSGAPARDVQLMLDELSAAMDSGEIKKTPPQYFMGLVKQYEKQQFHPARASRVAERREREQQHVNSPQHARASPTPPDVARTHLAQLKRQFPAN
ncbi:hypothetical protein [Burkholderia singularis]|uniref:hypothetical protein n=1 Tax=Burkholderia singularis TaxID=1503053 RepID=UPI00117C4A71|nr:hypothetical protein [Burkholderia singularis]